MSIYQKDIFKHVSRDETQFDVLTATLVAAISSHPRPEDDTEYHTCIDNLKTYIEGLFSDNHPESSQYKELKKFLECLEELPSSIDGFKTQDEARGIKEKLNSYNKRYWDYLERRTSDVTLGIDKDFRCLFFDRSEAKGFSDDVKEMKKNFDVFQEALLAQYNAASIQDLKLKVSQKNGSNAFWGKLVDWRDSFKGLMQVGGMLLICFFSWLTEQKPPTLNMTSINANLELNSNKVFEIWLTDKSDMACDKLGLADLEIKSLESRRKEAARLDKIILEVNATASSLEEITGMMLDEYVQEAISDGLSQQYTWQPEMTTFDMQYSQVDFQEALTFKPVVLPE